MPNSNSPPQASLSKFELEEKMKKYKYVLFKLHKELEQKDEEIARLNQIIDRQQQRLNRKD